MNKFMEYVPMHHIETKVMQAMGFDIINLDGRGKKTYDSSLLHRHTFFELFFFTGGKGDHRIDFSHYPVEKNSAHFVSPGQIHKLVLQKTQGYVLCFTGDFVSLQANESFVEKFPFYDTSGSPVVNVNKLLGEELGLLIASIENEFLLPGKTTTEILRSYLNIVLLKIRTSFLEQQETLLKPSRGKNAKVIRFRNMIDDNYLLHKPVSEYASELGLSPNHLNALCKLHEGKTAIQLLQERLLLEAKRLLYATDLNIKEISFRLKFEDVAYFNRFFKKQAQLTPAKYRQDLQKNR